MAKYPKWLLTGPDCRWSCVRQLYMISMLRRWLKGTLIYLANFLEGLKSTLIKCRLMHFPTWVDLKGQDSVPDTVHHVVLTIDPKDRNLERIWKRIEEAVPTDGVHYNDRISTQSSGIIIKFYNSMEFNDPTGPDLSVLAVFFCFRSDCVIALFFLLERMDVGTQCVKIMPPIQPGPSGQ